MRDFNFRMLIGLLAVAVATGAPVFAQESGESTPAAAGESSGPKISFETKTIDLGEVPKGEQARYTFTFKNEGDETLVIEEAKPSCGCTVADFTKKVEPGQTGTVVATVDTKRFRGPISKTVTVSSNDPVNPKVHLTAKATVKPFVDVLPSQHVFLRADRGQGATKTVTLVSYEEGKKLEIEKIESSNEFVTAVAHPIEPGAKDEEGNPIEGDYEVDVRLADNAPTGRVNAKVDIHTNSEKAPVVTLQVRGSVRGLVQVRPSRVFLGNLDEKIEEPITKKVRVTARGDSKVKIEKVESSLEQIAAKVIPVEDGKTYDIELTIEGTLPRGPLDEVVTIYTDDPEEKEVQVKVRGQVG